MRRTLNNTRRSFLKGAVAAAPAALGGMCGGLQAKSVAASLGSGDAAALSPAFSRNYLGKNTRLSISMWDFSWLMAHYPGGAYQDLEQRVAEAAERGYNTLRIDCFPSRVLELDSTFPKKDWVPGVNLPRWGEIAVEHTCNVRKEVARLADLCRKHGLWLGLDSWDVANMFRSARVQCVETSGAPSGLFGERSVVEIPVGCEEQAFTAYGEIWVRALRLMREDGVLERAVWIAPMNEVPNFAGGSVESIRNLRNAAKNLTEAKREADARLDSIYQQINNYMGAPISAEIAKDHIPLSYCSNGDRHYSARVTDIYDVFGVAPSAETNS